MLLHIKCTQKQERDKQNPKIWQKQCYYHERILKYPHLFFISPYLYVLSLSFFYHASAFGYDLSRPTKASRGGKDRNTEYRAQSNSGKFILIIRLYLPSFSVSRNYYGTLERNRNIFSKILSEFATNLNSVPL